MRQLIAALFILATMLSTACPAYATDSHWIAQTGDWANPANWTGNPATATGFLIDNGGAATLSTSAVTTPVTVSSGELIQTGGLVSSSGAGITSPTVNVLPAGKYTITGGESTAIFAVQGTMIQEGGVVEFGQQSSSGPPGIDVSGRYELKSGALGSSSTYYATYIRISSLSGTAEFVQTGGAVNIGLGSVQVGHGSNSIGDPPTAGRYTISGGSLSATAIYLGNGSLHQGELNVTDNSASITTNLLTIVTGGSIRAVPGTVIRVQGQQGAFNGSFQNYTADAAAVADLANVTLDFEKGISYMNVKGSNLGAVEAGYQLNFAVGTLAIGREESACLRLQGSTASTVAQYVENVVLAAGSTLDMAGRKLYYKTFTNLGGTLLINGGQFAQVPDAAWHVGDANIDGQVTDADYTLWVDNYGKIGAAWAEGDFSGDGQATDADYTLWADNYGFGVTGNAVPEPATLSLLGAGLLAIIRRRAA